MNEYEKEIELMDFLNVLWKRKWLIIIPTFFFAIIAGVYSFLLPRVWEVDAIIQPSQYTLQTIDGTYKEILTADPKQIAGQINEALYNHIIAAELNLDIREIPKLKAANLRDTNLVKISTKVNDAEKAKLILYSLFNHLKRDLDKKIDVEIKSFDTNISTNENLIKKNKIKQNKIRQEIISAANKLKISESRVISIMEEMKSVKKRIGELEEQQRRTLSEKKQITDAISLLLHSDELQHYSNEVQLNLRIYNTLDEKLSDEKIIQEDLKLNKEEKKTEIENVNNEIENVKDQIALLNKKKARVDYAQLTKEPTSSLGPVFPKKKRNVMLAGILGLMIFTMFAFFLEYIKKQKLKS